MEDFNPIAYALRFNTINSLDVFVKKIFKDLAVETLINIRKEFALTVQGYIIMSDHMSLVVIPEDPKDIALFSEKIKRKISQKVMDILENNGFTDKRWLLFLVNFINKDNSEAGGNRIWCPDNPVKKLYSEEEIQNELKTIYHEPVDEGIVSQIEEYNYSSCKENLVEQLLFDRQAV